MRGRGYRFWDAKRNFYAPDDDFWITYKGEWATHLCSKYISYKGSDIIAEQSTGLSDRNGKEIYEGDILHFDIQDYNGGDHVYTLPVSYDIDSYSCLSIKHDTIFNIGQIQAEDDEWEVVGNIHENLELLEATK